MYGSANGITKDEPNPREWSIRRELFIFQSRLPTLDLLVLSIIPIVISWIFMGFEAYVVLFRSSKTEWLPSENLSEKTRFILKVIAMILFPLWPLFLLLVQHRQLFHLR